jgi:hypothetical protein
MKLVRADYPLGRYSLPWSGELGGVFTPCCTEVVATLGTIQALQGGDTTHRELTLRPHEQRKYLALHGIIRA